MSGLVISATKLCISVITPCTVIQCISEYKLGCQKKLLTTQGSPYPFLYLQSYTSTKSTCWALSVAKYHPFLQKRLILHNDRGLTDDERLRLKLLCCYKLMCDVAREVVGEARFHSEQIRITHLNERTVNLS